MSSRNGYTKRAKVWANCIISEFSFFRSKMQIGTSLVVQWLRLCTPDGGGMASILGLGAKILHAMHGIK